MRLYEEEKEKEICIYIYIVIYTIEKLACLQPVIESL